MLSVKDHMTLALEAKRWHYAGAKDQAIRDTFDERPTQFAARVLRLLDDPDALREYPQLVRRLQRLRDDRRALRRAS